VRRVLRFRTKQFVWALALQGVFVLAAGYMLWWAPGAGAWQASLEAFLEAGLLALAVGALIALRVTSISAGEIERSAAAWELTQSILNCIPAGIVVIDPANHHIVDANRAALKAFKARKWRVIGKVCHQFICPAEKGYCPITDLGQKVDSSERLLVRAGGAEVPIFKTAIQVKLHGRHRLLEIFYDVSERKDLERRLRDAYSQQEKAANYDILTGLLNRRAIDKHAEAELCRAERGGELCLALMDFDRFKSINDNHGHQVGDDVLRRTAELIGEHVRPYDWVGRWGGEEFLLLLPDTSISEAVEVAERLRLAVAATELPLPGGGSLRFTASFGVSGTAQAPRKTASIEKLIAQADEALYRAKQEGRNRVYLFEPQDKNGVG